MTTTDRPLIATDTDPWIEVDGEVVDLLPILSGLTPGTDCDCWAGVFAPTSTGPTGNGIERCDACDRFPGDLEAAEWVASLCPPGARVVYLADVGEDADGEPITVEVAAGTPEVAARAAREHLARLERELDAAVDRAARDAAREVAQLVSVWSPGTHVLPLAPDPDAGEDGPAWVLAGVDLPEDVAELVADLLRLVPTSRRYPFVAEVPSSGGWLLDLAAVDTPAPTV